MLSKLKAVWMIQTNIKCLGGQLDIHHDNTELMALLENN